jgi:hypothetical protein
MCLTCCGVVVNNDSLSVCLVLPDVLGAELDSRVLVCCSSRALLCGADASPTAAAAAALVCLVTICGALQDDETTYETFGKTHTPSKRG